MLSKHDRRPVNHQSVCVRHSGLMIGIAAGLCALTWGLIVLCDQLQGAPLIPGALGWTFGDMVGELRRSWAMLAIFATNSGTSATRVVLNYRLGIISNGRFLFADLIPEFFEGR